VSRPVGRVAQADTDRPAYFWQTSTTYDTFMYLSLPLPSQNSKISVYELIDDFTKPEILDGDDAWSVDT
jgi:ubiquitin C-terminal hydrolase